MDVPTSVVGGCAGDVTDVAFGPNPTLERPMPRTALWIVGIVVAFALGAVLGVSIAVDRTMDMMINNAVDADQRAVRVYVEVLGDLRAGDVEAGTERLESWLDDVLIVVMEPSNYEYDLGDLTVARADSAFAEAYAYRDAYPRTSGRGFVDEMVANVWAAGPPGGLR